MPHAAPHPTGAGSMSCGRVPPPAAQAAQQLILQAVSAPTAERSFEANSYTSLARAHLAAEKVQVVARHLEGMQQVRRGHAGGMR